VQLVFENNPYDEGANGQRDTGGLGTSQLFIVDNKTGYTVASIFHRNGKYCLYSTLGNREYMFRQYESFGDMINAYRDFIGYDGLLERTLPCAPGELEAGIVGCPFIPDVLRCNRVHAFPRTIIGGSYASVRTLYSVAEGPGRFIRFQHYSHAEQARSEATVCIEVEFRDKRGNRERSPRMYRSFRLDYDDFTD